MPTASSPPASSSGKSAAGITSNDTPVTIAKKPSRAARKDGNMPSTRPTRASIEAPSSTDAQSANPGDHTNARVHDNPSQTEHANRALEKLNGVSAKRVNAPMPGRSGKAGFDIKSLRKPSKMGSGIKGR
jgi:hypothetical protein